MISDDQAVGVAFIFGVAYNAMISWFRCRYGYENAPVAIEVIVGVLVVLAIVALIDADKHYAVGSHMLTNGESAAWLALRCFAGAGIPMFFGSTYRSVKKML